MQPIKSVLPFCSALPIQYTPSASVSAGFGIFRVTGGVVTMDIAVLNAVPY